MVSDKSHRWREGDAGWRGERRRSLSLHESQGAGKGRREPARLAAKQARVGVKRMGHGSTGWYKR